MVDADDAVAGTVEDISANPATASSTTLTSATVDALKPFKPDPDKDPAETSWIEIEMVDENGDPVPGECYRVTLPDGETCAEGTLDENGFAHIDGIDPGNCQITFPNLDQDAWEKSGG